MGRKARREALLEVETIEDDAAIWDELWGHVAGNLSHWHCLPPAIAPGVDYDGSPTSYDTVGVFTGSVTVVGGADTKTSPRFHDKCVRPTSSGQS